MRIKDLYGVLHFDTMITISNKRDGEIFRGYSEEFTDELMEYRVVVVKATDNIINITAVK